MKIYEIQTIVWFLIITEHNSAWPECIVWGDEVVGSNPTVPTNLLLA